MSSRAIRISKIRAGRLVKSSHYLPGCQSSWSCITFFEVSLSFYSDRVSTDSKADGIQETLSERVPEPWIVHMPKDNETGLAVQDTQLPTNTRSTTTTEDAMELLSHRASIAGQQNTSTEDSNTYHRLSEDSEHSHRQNSEDQTHGEVPRSLTV